jgi:hypothetical protein
MEDDVKARFEELDKRLQLYEKRHDDFKWYFSGITALFGLGFGILTLILSWNYSNERASLREFQRDIKTELGKVEAPPELEILGPNREPLSGQEIKVDLQRVESGFLSVNFTCIYRNNGDTTTGPLSIKFYTVDPLVLSYRSTDEDRFKYETYMSAEHIDPNQLPGHFSIEQFINLGLSVKDYPPPGRYPFMIKVFYGKGKVKQSSFTVLIPQG